MGYTTFKAKYVLHTFPDYTKEPTPFFRSSNLWLKNPLGVDSKYRMEDYPKFGVNNKYSFTKAQEISDFNALFDSCYGRMGSLWLPSWNRDFLLTNNIGSGDNHIHIVDCDYATYYPSTPGTGRYIFIYVNDAKWYARKIESVYESNQLIMESSLGESLTTSQVQYVCILYLVRFDLDELEWSFITPMVGEVEVDFIEVPHEYGDLA